MDAATLMQMIGVMAQARPVNTGLSAQLLDGQDQAVPAATPTVAAPAAAAGPVGTVAQGVPNGFAGLVQQSPAPAIPLPTNPVTTHKGGFSKGNILSALLGSNFGM